MFSDIPIYYVRYCGTFSIIFGLDGVCICLVE